MMLIEAVGAIAILWLKRAFMPLSAASGQAPRSSARMIRRRIGFAADLLEDAQIPGLGHRAFQRNVLGLQEGVEAHHAQARPSVRAGAEYLARSMLSGAVSMKLVSTLSSIRSTSSTKPSASRPLVPGLDIERGQAAHRGAFLAVMVGAGGQGDLAAQIGGVDLQAQLALMLGQRPVHRVDVEDIGLAGLQPGFQDALPQLAGIDLAQHLAGLGALAGRTARSSRTALHEFVGDVDAVMEIEALAVEVAARPCGFPGTPRSPDGRCRDRPPPMPRRSEPWLIASVSAVHHMDEGNDAAGLAGLHLLADGADLAPIGADAAAIGRQPDILVPGADNAVAANPTRH